MNTTATGTSTQPRIVRVSVPPQLAFAVVAALWLAFAAALIASPGTLDALYRAVGDLWLPLRALVWLLFLPWMLGLWAWESGWALWLRLPVVAGLAVATLGAFFPRQAQS